MKTKVQLTFSAAWNFIEPPDTLELPEPHIILHTIVLCMSYGPSGIALHFIHCLRVSVWTVSAYDKKFGRSSQSPFSYVTYFGHICVNLVLLMVFLGSVC